MQIGLVVDAACDLPEVYLETHGIRVLPSILQIDGRTWLDDRAPEQSMTIYRRFIADRAVAASSIACSQEEIREIFLQELVLEFDRVLVICAGADFSDMHGCATEASYAILQGYRERREAAARPGGFTLRVLDSGTVCAGEAVLACRAQQLIAERKLGFDKMRRQLREEAARVSCLLVPADPWYLRYRGLDGKGRGIGRLDQARAVISELKPVVELSAGRRSVIGRPRGFEAGCRLALERAQAALAVGLGAPVLALSFGGDPRVIREMPAYQALESRAAEARVELQLAVMSATMGVRLGPGALSVAWLGGA